MLYYYNCRHTLQSGLVSAQNVNFVRSAVDNEILDVQGG